MNWFTKISEGNEKMMIIARGPSGSGKSHMVQSLAKQHSAPIFSSDDYFMKDGKYVFNGSEIGRAHEWNRQRVAEAAKSSSPVIIVDNTNTQFWEMKPYVEIANQYGYEVKFVEPDWHPELKTPEGKWNSDFIKQQQRNKNRADINKTLPDDVVDKMIGRYQYGPTVDSVLQSRNPYEKRK